ncbi:MAG: adenylate/guanylate cyclase domain-containing protein [Desulfobacterales bacterium]
MDDSKTQNMITSKEVLKKTGISRATLNNYIKMGILPKPDVRKAGEDLQGTKHIGYFPESVIWRIDLVKRLKQEGEPMERIARQFGKDSRVVHMFPDRESDVEAAGHIEPDDVAPESMPLKQTEMPERIPLKPDKPEIRDAAISVDRRDFTLTISDLKIPAYLVNHNFEVEWINPEAEKLIFNRRITDITDIESRNIFKLFFGFEFQSRVANWKDIVSHHMPIDGLAFSRETLSDLYSGISEAEADCLKDIYDADSSRKQQPEPIDCAPLQLFKQDGSVDYFKVYRTVFREGTLFVYAPAEEVGHDLMAYLSKREIVIKDLLKHRMPSLVSLCVLVADLQDSVKISAELLPGEYFSLINGLWESLAGCFDEFNGIYGKHAGDGMLYYFVKKPGNDYLMNAIHCALELRKRMKEFSSRWKIKKNWFEDMYLNIGINEGHEFFGTIRSAPTIEFTALGDSINYAGRLSDFARNGQIWTTKSVIGKLDASQVECLQFGVNRNVRGQTVFTQNTFSRIIDFLEKDDHEYGKFIDIATLPITQIMDYAG